MNNICNIFNPLDKSNGNFLLFSQYVEDLSKSVVDSTYRVRPSRFFCMNLDNTVINNAKNLTALTEGDASTTPFNNVNRYLPGFFQNNFENAVSSLRSGKVTGLTPLTVTPFNYSVGLVEKLMQLTNSGDDIGLQTYVKYVGNIDATSWEDGFADIILSIGSGSPIPSVELNSNLIVTPASGSTPATYKTYRQFVDEWCGEQQYSNTEGQTSGTYYINGWVNDDNLPVSGKVRATNTIGYPGATDHFSSSLSVFEGTNGVLSFTYPGMPEYPDTPITSFVFNTILLTYDIEVNNSTVYRDVPLGIYFTGDVTTVDSTTNINNPVTIYNSSDTAYGAGSGWSLRICTRFSAIPYGNLKVEEISLEQGAIPASISRIISAAAETIKEIRSFTDETIYNSQGFRDLTNLIKDGKINVPYIREVNGTKYWFVNGRNTEVPVYPPSTTS